jgi:hypothetical protein
MRSRTHGRPIFALARLLHLLQQRRGVLCEQFGDTSDHAATIR